MVQDLRLLKKGELLAFKLTPGNVDDRKPVPEMTSDPADFQSAKERASVDSRHYWSTLIETVNDQLKNIFLVIACNIVFILSNSRLKNIYEFVRKLKNGSCNFGC